jgi:hypothetical protein
LAQTNYLDSAVTNGVTYYYVVSAVNSGLESYNSPPVNAIPLSPPTMSISYDQTNLVISWTNPVFLLQAATNVTGPFTDLIGTPSPFSTNPVGNQFFRLRH